MATADILTQIDCPDLPADAHSLIERSFAGGGAVNPGDPIATAFRHHFQAPGGATRIRLLNDCARHLGLASSDILCLAATVECLHNASLVQDDLQDRSTHRRGQASVASRFGDDVALGLTNRLITTAFVCLSGICRLPLLPSLIRQINFAVAETVEGQTSELTGFPEDASVEAHLSAARKKSGPLFALSLELPLILAGHHSFLSTAHEAATCFGLGYQILDDLKDRELDMENPASGNMVLKIEREAQGGQVPGSATDLARHFLLESAKNAAMLPSASGEPLVLLVELLLPQIDAFKP